MRPASPMGSFWTDAGVLDRMVSAVEKVRTRMVRASRALAEAGVPYAIVGGNAVAAWVATIDEAAVRNTQDVDVMLRREDLDRAREALVRAGFIHRHAAGLDLFLDDANSSPRSAIHIVFAGEHVRPGEPASNPDLVPAVDLGPVRVIALESLVRIKLTAFRDKDRTHLRDLIEVGLVDRSWPDRLDPVLADRLRGILASPDG